MAVSNVMSVCKINLDDENLKTIKQIWGGAMGFNFNNGFVETLFVRILNQIKLGSFNDGGSTREGFVAHRHDQAVLSALAYKDGLQLFPYGVIAAKNDINEKTYIVYGD
jgi:hypothetical protein